MLVTLTNTDGKIFFSIIASRLDHYLMSNNFIDKHIQKGFVKNIPGCIEHSSLLLEALSNAAE